jgi:hypothetical protein
MRSLLRTVLMGVLALFLMAGGVSQAAAAPGGPGLNHPPSPAVHHGWPDHRGEHRYHPVPPPFYGPWPPGHGPCHPHHGWCDRYDHDRYDHDHDRY